MRSRILAAFAVFVMVPVSSTAIAQPMRQEQNQRHRIQQGTRSGELSRQEARYLKQQNRYISRLKRYYMRDGRYTARERQDIRRREQRLNRRIYQMKHNSWNRR